MPLTEQAIELFRAGGWVMWPLLALSVLSVTLTVERSLFWVSTNSRRRSRALSKIAALIREGDFDAAFARASDDHSVYGRLLERLLRTARGPKAGPVSESYALEEAETLRSAIDRFSATQSTIISAAPMLGILGTVTGIIESFRLIGSAQTITDPAQVAGGISEALFTTAFGLAVALATLFPHALFRAQADSCLARIEMLAGTVIESTKKLKRAD
ncbi:MAG: MotA/TolQ/ExbB proton channel family protein [Planctomycetota bacterium]